MMAMIILDILLGLIIIALCKTILWLKLKLDLAIIDRDAAQRMADLKIRQYDEMKAFAGDSISAMKKMGVQP